MSEVKVFCVDCRYHKIGLHGYDYCHAPKQTRKDYVYHSLARCTEANPTGDCKHHRLPLKKRK